MRILFLSATLPFPPVGGGPLRAFHLLQAIACEHDVTIAGFTFGTPPDEPPFPLQMIAVPWELPRPYRDMQSEDAGTAHAAADFLAQGTSEPWFVSFYESEVMADALRAVTASPFDLIIIDDTDMARFLPCLPADVPKILDLHNVYSLWARRTAEAASEDAKTALEREAARTLRFESAAARACSLSVVCSDAEADAARNLLDVNEVAVVPNGVDTSYFRPIGVMAAHPYILFTGTMNHPPNEEAACWFASSVLPLIQRRYPDAEFHVAGRDPTPKLAALRSNSVLVHGFVDDIRPYFDAAAVVVAPILSGGGTRLKILEAGACAKPVVSTRLGAEGLGLVHDRHLLLAEDAASFAKSIILLLEDAGKRHRLGEALHEAVLRFDWKEIEAGFARVVNRFQAATADVAAG